VNKGDKRQVEDVVRIMKAPIAAIEGSASCAIS
jgi:hypothetical protein